MALLAFAAICRIGRSLKEFYFSKTSITHKTSYSQQVRVCEKKAFGDITMALCEHSNHHDDVVMFPADVLDLSTKAASRVLECGNTMKCETGKGMPSLFEKVGAHRASPAARDLAVGDETTSISFSKLSPSKRRRVCFPKECIESAVYEIPSLSVYPKEASDPENFNIRNILFYNDADYQRFRANEQKRYLKLISKKVQKMVQEKLQPSINEAVANGATLEDIEAMMPKTHDEMMTILGEDRAKLPPAAFAAAFGGVNGDGTARGKSIATETDRNTAECPAIQRRTIRETRSSISIHGRNGDEISEAAAAAAAMLVTDAE